jgi:hypothetical protein
MTNEEILRNMIEVSNSVTSIDVFDYQFGFGKYKGLKVSQVAKIDLQYLDWVLENVTHTDVSNSVRLFLISLNYGKIKTMSEIVTNLLEDENYESVILFKKEIETINDNISKLRDELIRINNIKPPQTSVNFVLDKLKK